MQIHNIKGTTKLKKHKTVGRGGKRGKTSGRGTKGQNARAGRKKRPEIRDIIKKLPKQRGYKFKSIQPKPTTITLAHIEKLFAAQETVSPIALAGKGVTSHNSGTLNRVKILATGELSKPLTFSHCLITKGALEKIKKAGGTIA